MFDQLKVLEKTLTFISRLSLGRFMLLLIFIVISLTVWRTESLEAILDFMERINW